MLACATARPQVRHIFNLFFSHSFSNYNLQYAAAPVVAVEAYPDLPPVYNVSIQLLSYIKNLVDK